MAGVYERVYEVGPVFRAEPHDTARHTPHQPVHELRLELGFTASHIEVMAVLVSVLRGMVDELRAPCAAELALLGATLPEVRPHASDFVFVVGYPMVQRPFYTHRDPGRPAHSRSFDLLFAGTELVTGGQRLRRGQVIARATLGGSHRSRLGAPRRAPRVVTGSRSQ